MIWLEDGSIKNSGERKTQEQLPYFGEFHLSFLFEERMRADERDISAYHSRKLSLSYSCSIHVTLSYMLAGISRSLRTYFSSFKASHLRYDIRKHSKFKSFHIGKYLQQ